MDDDLHALGEDLITTAARVVRWVPKENGFSISLAAARLLAHRADWCALPGRLTAQELRDLYRGADLYAAPAVLEAFGIAAAEARCCGLPVITRAQSAVADLVQHERTGLVVANDEEFAAALEAASWDEIVAQSGIDRDLIRRAARIYIDAERVIACWAMGLTQHKNGVANIQEVVNLLLLRGNLGKPGAGACPVRGHSNVQGDRTMGINERPAAEFLDRLGRAANAYAASPPAPIR